MNRDRLITLFAAFLMSEADKWARAGISIEKASDLVLEEIKKVNDDAVKLMEERIDALAQRKA